MKELSIEEKAKAYDEALEKAKIWQEHLYDANDKDYADELNYIFPELQKSEDEFIREKLIIRFLGYDDEESFGGIKIKDIIAWLEKQGKNNIGISEATKQELEDNLNKALEKETPESWNEFLDGQGKQKPAEVRTTGYWHVEDVEQKPVGCPEYCVMSNCANCPYYPVLIKKPNEWGEEDQKIASRIASVLEEAASEHAFMSTKRLIGDKEVIEIEGWLKSLEEKIQPRREWSEEDGRCIRYLIECLEVCVKGTAIKMLPSTAQKYIEWLKSLRPQNTWKPSDYELEVLRLAAEKDGACLMGLYEQLLKLREE